MQKYIENDEFVDKVYEAVKTIGDDAIPLIEEHLNIHFKDGKCCCPFHQENTPSFVWNPKTKNAHCFRKDTKVITNNGVFSIQDIIDKDVYVLNGNGEWEKTKFVFCGQDTIYKLTLMSHGKIKEIYTTKDHEWFLRQSTNTVTTEQLYKYVGKKHPRFLRSILPQKQQYSIDEDGLRHGFIYGDGYRAAQRKNGDSVYSIGLYTKRKYAIGLKLFDNIKFYQHKHNESKEYFGTAIYKSNTNMKSVPSIEEYDDNYLYSFLVGAFLTDGNCSDDSILFSSSKLDDLKEIQNICIHLNIATYPIGFTIRTPKSNGRCVTYTKNYTLYTMRIVSTTLPDDFLILSEKQFKRIRKYPASLGYKIISVENTGIVDDVYCCETSTQSFALDGFILTHNCFGCNKTYNIVNVLVDKTGSHKEALNELFRMAHMEVNTYGYKPFDGGRTDWFANYKYPHPEHEPTEEHSIKYLNMRGISKQTIDYAEVTEDSHGNIAFEYHDLDNKLLCVKYRASHKLHKGEAKMWFQKDASTVPILYNVKKLDYLEPLVINEGEIDTLSVIESGYTNACSVPNGAGSLNWVEFNYDYLQNFQTLILWFDNDAAGQEGLNKIIPRLGEYRCKIVKPTPEDEQMVEDYYAQFGREGIRKTDANNILLACGKQRVIELINRAEEIPAKNLKYLMDCEITDIKDVEKVSTGLKGMDDILFGNLMSCFTIYTGRAGSGKSSLCNLTSIIAPIEQGHRVFVFSGELSEGQLLDWIMSPLAGLNHLRVWDSEKSARKAFTVTDEAETAIRKYYHDNIILYSAENELATSEEDLVDAMETAYRKYGCDTFVIDNLMTIDFTTAGVDNKYEQQKKFITRLMNFTNTHNVNISCVSHPKKVAAGEDLDIYSLHGASELSNLCHRLIAVKRLTDDEEGYSIECQIIKDRPTQAAGKSCKLMYDTATRRIYSTNEELSQQFSWEKSSNINYPDAIKKNLLCNRKDVLATIPKIVSYSAECDQY